MNDRLNKLKALAGIAAIIAGASVGVVVLLALFSPSQLPVAAWVVTPLCLMGTALGFLVSRESR